MATTARAPLASSSRARPSAGNASDSTPTRPTPLVQKVQKQETESDQSAPPTSAPPRLGAPPLPDPHALPDASAISSPHELTEWVDKLADSLEARFGEMSQQVEARMREMSTRIDAIESSIEDLIQGAIAPVPSSNPRSTAGAAPSSSVAETTLD